MLGTPGPRRQLAELPFQGYHEYIDENLPPESPYLYGLHPNAEIGFLTVTSEKLFRTVLEMQPKETDSGAGTGVSREEKVGAWLPGRRQEGQGPGLGSQALGPLGTWQQPHQGPPQSSELETGLGGTAGGGLGNVPGCPRPSPALPCQLEGGSPQPGPVAVAPAGQVREDRPSK